MTTISTGSNDAREQLSARELYMNLLRLKQRLLSNGFIKVGGIPGSLADYKRMVKRSRKFWYSRL